MTRAAYLALSATMLFLYAAAWLFDLDLGWFGWSLLISAFAFAMAALGQSRSERP